MAIAKEKPTDLQTKIGKILVEAGNGKYREAIQKMSAPGLTVYGDKKVDELIDEVERMELEKNPMQKKQMEFRLLQTLSGDGEYKIGRSESGQEWTPGSERLEMCGAYGRSKLTKVYDQI